MKRWIAVLLTLAVILSIFPVSHAVDAAAQDAAETLYEKGLFLGTDMAADGTPVFSLERVPSRLEAITMLVRLLGAEEEALSGDWQIPFSDVADWAVPYVGYAYEKGLTAGTSAATYGGEEPVTAAQYLTFMLRVLGYESGVDFAWEQAWAFSDALGLTDGRYTEQNNRAFTRGDAAILSLATLNYQNAAFSPVSDRTYTKEELMTRTLTDQEIRELQQVGLPQLKREISTYGDFAAWVRAQNARYYHRVDARNGEGMMFGAGYLYVWMTENLGSNMIASLGMYLLEDDYDGIGILAGLTYENGERGVLASNYIPVKDGCLILSAEEETGIAKRHQETPMVFTGGKVQALSEAADRIPKSQRLAQLWQITTSEDLYFAYGNCAMTPESKSGARLLYEDPTASLRTGAPALASYGFANAADAKSALTPESGLALSHGTLEEAAAAITTMADAFAYLYYSGFAVYEYDLFVSDSTSGLDWHFNRLPERVFAVNGGNCGGTSGLVADLLEGDYEEVGLISMTFQAGEGGGHVVNYVKDGGLYYVFDPVNLVSSGFQAGGLNLQYADTLKTAAEKWAKHTTWNEKLMIAYESKAGDLPMGWNTTNVTYLPKNGAESQNRQILLETESQGYLYQTVSVDQQILDEMLHLRQTK